MAPGDEPQAGQGVPPGRPAARPALCRALADAADRWTPELLADRGDETVRASFTRRLRAAAAGGAAAPRR